MGNATPRLCFGDLPELDHVIEMLNELAEISDDPQICSIIENSPIPVIIQRLESQIAWQREQSEESHPGAFDRSYLAEEYDETLDILINIRFSPWELAANIDLLALKLHRVMIIGNLSETELVKTLKTLETTKLEADSLRRPAETGRKIIDGGKKGREHGANASNPGRDAEIYNAFMVEMQKPLVAGEKRRLAKTARLSICDAFGIGDEAVRKAIQRHQQRQPA